jgi:hypothetical protein
MKPQYVAQRAEDRFGMKVTALLVGRHGQLGVEKAITENVSSSGARVISANEWDPDDTILVALPSGHFTSVARVTYCDSLGGGKFGTGLQFIGESKHLEINTLATAPEFEKI